MAAFWQAAILLRWVGEREITLGGWLEMAPWTPPSTPAPTAEYGPWPCRPMGEFWWAAHSLRWADTQPVALTDSVGATVSFSVRAAGTTPMSYQWRNSGVDLFGGGNNSGTQTAALSITNVSGADRGGYSVVINNDVGSVTSLVASLTVLDPVITNRPVSQATTAGQTTGFSVGAAGSPPSTCQWCKDGVSLADGGNVSGAHTPLLTLSNVLRADVGASSFIISNTYGCLTSQVATMSVVDPYINVHPVSTTVFSGQTATFSVAAAGTALLGYQWRKNGLNLDAATGSSLTFTNVQRTDRGNYDAVVGNVFGSVTSTAAVLTVDPATEDSFNPAANAGVSAFAVQPDGRIVVAGGFNSLGGQSHPYLARINLDGSVDSTFNPSADYAVYCLALQQDGKIVVGGMFQTFCGQPRRHLGRLNSDGTLDEAFSAAADGSGPYAYYVYGLAMQTDGKILVGGSFETLAGVVRNGIGRLNTDGTLDPDFNPACDSGVGAVAVQPDGKILVGGSFTTLGGQARSCIGRLNADGTLDADFAPQATGAW